MGTIFHLSKEITNGLLKACPWQRKTQREKLSLAIASFLVSKTANTMETAALLPIRATRTDMKYQWLSRLLANPLVIPAQIMGPFVKQMMEQMPGKLLEIVIDQTHIKNTHSILMISLRWGNRGLPLFWKVKKGLTNLDFIEQKELLEKVRRIIPEKKVVRILGDRFYGSKKLILLCKEWDWDYRLRLKKNIRLKKEDGKYRKKVSTLHREAKKGLFLKKVEFGKAQTNIGGIWEKGHKEPWVIAMKQKPNKESTMDYGHRWSIEALFSDFKSRGMGLEDTQLEYPDRVERLILILSLAIYWAMKAGKENEEKKTPSI